MRILAVDQARKGAWAVFDYEYKKLEAFDVFNFPSPKYTYPKAIRKIEDLIYETIEKYGIDAVFFEDIQLRFNPQSYKCLAQLQGVLINLCEKNGYTYGVITPSQWQNYCKARGRNTKEVRGKVTSAAANGKKASKAFSIETAKELYQVDTENDNLADSILIGHYVVNNITIDEKGDINKNQ